MAVTAPDWLARHGGELRSANAGPFWLVLLDGEPQYRLIPVPAAGKHSCHVTQTVNGQRLDSGKIHSTQDEAIQGGLEDLRQTLGW
jgi:hypothetical protein